MTDQIVPVEQPEMRLGIIPARTPHDVIVQATRIAKELADIIKANKLFVVIQDRKFVRVEGWSTMGAMLGVLPREVPELTHRFDDGSYEATVELIRISDNAIIGRASAFVGMDEKDRKGQLTWGSRAEYARRSMAVTRATGKAYRLGFSWIIALAGYEVTPAEEIPDVIEGQAREVSEARGVSSPPDESTHLASSGAGASESPVIPNGKAPGGGTRKDAVDPKIQALIDAGISPDVPDAAGVLNILKMPGAQYDELIATAKRYRAWLDVGKTYAEAAAKAKAGEKPV